MYILTSVFKIELILTSIFYAIDIKLCVCDADLFITNTKHFISNLNFWTFFVMAG